MNTLRIGIISALVLLSFTAASGPLGSGGVASCGNSLSVRDSLLRAQFAALDRAQPSDLGSLCTPYRNAAIAR
jgi:hypothetical protein